MARVGDRDVGGRRPAEVVDHRRIVGIDLTNYTPDLDQRSLKDAHFPWAVEKMAEFAVEKALSGEPTPKVPDWRALILR